MNKTTRQRVHQGIIFYFLGLRLKIHKKFKVGEISGKKERECLKNKYAVIIVEQDVC